MGRSRQRGQQAAALAVRLLLASLAASAAAAARPTARQRAAASQQPDERLFGWLGETYLPGQQPSRADGAGMSVVSWDPRIFHFRGFLSEQECDYLVSKAKPRLAKSGVSDAVTGEQKMSKVRTSSGMFFSRREDAVVARIEDRVAAVTMLPPHNGEGMQVLQYQVGEHYAPHHDYFFHPTRDANGGNRVATILMYLTDVQEGGETVFPHVARLPHQTAAAGWSNCSLQGLALKPRKGDATVFWSLRPDGTFDYRSLHGSCPVIRGEKYSATKWLHVGPFAAEGEVPHAVHRLIHAPPPPPVPSWCKDKHENCAMWAESGECEANPGFMVGTKAQPGDCLVSCGRCDLARPPPGAAVRQA